MTRCMLLLLLLLFDHVLCFFSRTPFTSILQVNRRFLIGQSVDSETTEGIKAILMSRGSIEQLHQVGRMPAVCILSIVYTKYCSWISLFVER